MMQYKKDKINDRIVNVCCCSHSLLPISDYKQIFIMLINLNMNKSIWTSADEMMLIDDIVVT